MPSRLAAPAHLLDAIFAHTNQLSWEARQLILRFLAGEDAQSFEREFVPESGMITPNRRSDANLRQILLHEERRSEMRCTSGRSKSYTIIDQIIFEMDYSSGCWRKLRRRIRVADKKNASIAPKDDDVDMNDVESDARFFTGSQGVTPASATTVTASSTVSTR